MGGMKPGARRAGRGQWTRMGILLLGAPWLVACAPWQVVGVEAEPAPVVVFVDGSRVEAIPASGIRLRADRAHILHFEREGYRAEQVVIESVSGEAGPRLRPGQVAVRLRPAENRGRRIDVELEAEADEVEAAK